MRYDIYQQPTSPVNTGRTLFLLGQSIDGPVQSPVYIQSLQQAVRIFGNEDRGDLVRAFKEANRYRNVSIYLMRISGKQARNALLGEVKGELVSLVTLKTIHGGNRYNHIRCSVQYANRKGTSSAALFFEMPSQIMKSRAYFLEDYPTIQDLIHRINQDTNNGKNVVYASSPYPHLSSDGLIPHNQTPALFQGGDDGLSFSKDDLYLALQECYEMLEGHHVDVICPVSARFDDTHPSFFYKGSSSYSTASYNKGDALTLVDTENQNLPVTFHEQLIHFCSSQERFGVMTHAVIGLQERSEDDYHSSSYLSKLVTVTAFSNRYGLVDLENGVWRDKGYYLSIFGHDFVFDDLYIANGCVLYAAMIASSGVQTTTNRTLPEGISLAFELPTDEMKTLAILGVVTARQSIKRGSVIASGVTAGLYGSPIHSVANIRMIQFTIASVNSAVEEMIGEPFTPVITQKELETRVTTVLEELKSLQYLRDYSFSVTTDLATGSGEIELSLLARYATEFVSTSAQITFNGL